MAEPTPIAPGLPITGMGFFGAAGFGVEAFGRTLRESRPFDRHGSSQLLPELTNGPFADHVERLVGEHPAGRRLLSAARRESAAVRMTLLAALEAWHDAGLAIDSSAAAQRVGCVVAANNHFDDVLEGSFAGQAEGRMVNPRERLACLDPYLIGVLSRIFGFQGHAATVGAQSAGSGAAVVFATALLRSGLLDHCLIVAPALFPSDSLRETLGNLGVVSRVAEDIPIRPFDSTHAGTLLAPIAAAVVLSAATEDDAEAVKVEGVGSSLHRSTGTEPDRAGEVLAMQEALRDAGRSAADIGYVNAHATGTPRGDEVEAQAIAEVFADAGHRPVVNATKAIVGHGFNSAGLVGVVATCLQLEHGFYHHTPGLLDPIEAFDQGPIDTAPAGVAALCNSFSFFGINTSLVLSSPAAERNSRR